MIHESFVSLARAAKAPAALLAIATLAGCSLFGGPAKPQPAELQPVTALVSARQSWVTRVGAVNFPLALGVSESSVAVASGDGTVALVDAATGRDIWRLALNTTLAAGAGNDGKVVAVVTRGN